MAKECCDNADDLNTLKTVQTDLKSAESVMQATKRHRLSQLESLQPSAKKLAPNVLHEKQVRFFLTKKKAGVAGPSKSRSAARLMPSLKIAWKQYTKQAVPCQV